jgi:hypothetical protein
MNDIKLTDFGIAELQIAVGLFEDKMDDITRKQQIISCFDESDLKSELTEQYKKDFEIVQLWKVQLENALGFVAQGERIASN